VAGRASGLYKTEWWGAGMVICLERVADLHMAKLMPPLTLSRRYEQDRHNSDWYIKSDSQSEA